MIFRRVGITFAVYGAKDEDGAGTERLIPFDLIPRIIPAARVARAWSRACASACTALNRFIHDVYHDQEILKAGIVPAEQMLEQRAVPPRDAGRQRAAATSTRTSPASTSCAPPTPTAAASYYVLEDNLRVPSGVSYMLENRKMMMRLFPELFSQHRVAPVAHYPDLLLETLRSVAPAGRQRPDGGGADARHVQQRLLRARLPGAADGHRAGRGPGPVRQGQLRLHAHDAAARSGST